MNSQFRFHSLSANGFSLIGVLAVVSLSAVFISVLLLQGNNARKREISAKEQSLAQVYASELAEYFRSFQTGNALSVFLGTHTAPLNGGTPYRFCEDINFMNRATNILQKPDPLANLAPSSLDLPTPNDGANRYFQVQVQNMTGAKPTWVSAKCGNFGPGLILTAAERVVVRVTVSWLSHSKRTPLSVSVSTVLPE